MKYFLFKSVVSIKIEGVTHEFQTLDGIKEDVIVMHPGPINRGIEISSEVIDGKSSLVDKQQVNGVAVRMAVMFLLAGRMN